MRIFYVLSIHVRILCQLLKEQKLGFQNFILANFILTFKFKPKSQRSKIQVQDRSVYILSCHFLPQNFFRFQKDIDLFDCFTKIMVAFLTLINHGLSRIGLFTFFVSFLLSRKTQSVGLFK